VKRKKARAVNFLHGWRNARGDREEEHVLHRVYLQGGSCDDARPLVSIFGGRAWGGTPGTRRSRRRAHSHPRVAFEWKSLDRCTDQTMRWTVPVAPGAAAAILMFWAL